MLNEVLFVHGVHATDGAAVMDCVGAALLQAEMQVNARQRLGLGVGRCWAMKPPPDILERLHAARRATAEALSAG
jgi:hypothetical protein